MIWSIKDTIAASFVAVILLALMPEIWVPAWQGCRKLYTALAHVFVRPDKKALDRRIALAMLPAYGSKVCRYRVEVSYNAPMLGRVDDYNHFGAYNPDEACLLARAYWAAEVGDHFRIKHCRSVEPGPMYTT